MIWYDIRQIVIMIPALASIYDICWVITDRCMYGPPPAPATHSTLESADAPLSSLRKSRCGGRLLPGHAPVQVYSYVWELQVLNLVYKILTSTCTCTHLPLRLTNPLRVRKLHFHLLGEARARAGWYTTHMLVQFNSGEHYLWVFFLCRLRIIQSIDCYMYARPPAPTPNQSLESADAPLSSPGRGRRRGWPAQPCSSSKYSLIYSL